MKGYKQLLIVVILMWASKLIASPQSPDYIVYGNDTVATYNLIVEQYLQSRNIENSETLFGLAFRDGATFNCWRGYQAIYEIQHDSLFLVDMIGCGELQHVAKDREASITRMKTVFGESFIEGKVFIDWYSGYLNFPLTDEVLRWDGVFYKIFEKERVLTLDSGRVSKNESVENYVDDPKGIDRKEKNEVSDILFRKLKREKWKNPDAFDCSEGYWVTIGADGTVSKVRMNVSDEEIKDYYEDDEYNFCINKIRHALSSLKFDILKDKGIPMAEDIFIEIWVEDNGKIENWTD
ncbi:hypothetical protein GCM10007415_42400 [Parapedobacter pyrenivorans]|uniref:Uncharacterized protein n=1 Tax=Parapedobacter pyrenivorans TaxID=1305674 RepID=A0A917I0H6_9SPHI|nr:hypothetical protein [Parapedobacter pyrenivorans]GGH01794.1 hypothetical protein GCM10007415_42400 [Parapedobacter pyrenivorans]